MSEQLPHPVGPGTALQGRPAGVVTRTIAGAVDYAVVALAAASTYAAVAALSFLYNPVSWRWPRWGFAALLVLAAAYMVGYLALCWATSGKTVGGQVMGTRVVHRDHRLHLVRAVVRAAVVVVFPIGLFWSAVDRRSRSVHDLMTGTTVVYSWRAEAVAPPR